MKIMMMRSSKREHGLLWELQIRGCSGSFLSKTRRGTTQQHSCSESCTCLMVRLRRKKHTGGSRYRAARLLRTLSFVSNIFH